MCRWLAYQGPEIYLDTLIAKPINSLINQSISSGGTITTHGDGFGIGWYSQHKQPGLYRDLYPAWNDTNLQEIAHHISSPLFFSHVRASTGNASASRQNSHPFRYQNWLFMHNGDIGGFPIIRKDLESLINNDYYMHKEGNTDSETLFYLMLSNGLASNPIAAIQTSINQLYSLLKQHSVHLPARMTICITDGATLYALRHSNDQQSPTLFYRSGESVYVDELGICQFIQGKGATLILSEPLDDQEHWISIEEDSLLTIHQGDIQRIPFSLLPRLE
ncbi:Amidohydrolase EgtC [Piscirickettsia salmonis]|uniref:class II glutamine amidotransferase n=1 Tax=Piscirickettsia salmonis TaxID=1238 RepID=UPI0012BAA265|nr:class II glutamine amidotransferase [Piscirickettsia salmonis]QGP55637.1 Amidohydrolase EgtC [Piscirickettsia salmonis]QGP58510.1 Amidohydrolase EgtC [Piscirickettsia salmonis]QGP65208.1 Amidohydrolase EgtC [Piscirickettsia salmonis]